MKFSIIIVSLLGSTRAIQLNRGEGDNISGLEIMANGTPEVFPLRGHPMKIEDTWGRFKSLANKGEGDNISGLEIMANGTPEVFPLRGHPMKIEDTWGRFKSLS